MSGRLVSAVFESTLPSWLKPYAAVCASFAADDGTRVRPGMTRLARLAGRSERATQTAVHELTRRGILILVTPHTPKRPAGYRFNSAALPGITDGAQLPLFPQAKVLDPGANRWEPDLFHSHAQGYTGSPLHPRGEAHFTRSVIDPSVATNHQTRAGARDTGKRQKTGTRD
jgi:hypothetical protein